MIIIIIIIIIIIKDQGSFFKARSSQVFPNFRYIKSIRSGQLANLNLHGTFSTSQFAILIILYQPEKTWLNGGFQNHRMFLLPSS